MDIEVRALHMKLTPRMRDHVERKFAAALQRFRSRIASVLVRIEDLNGPRGGADDKLCFVAVTGKHLPRVRIQARSDDPFTAVETAATRTSRGVARALDRHRERRGEARRASPKRSR